MSGITGRKSIILTEFRPLRQVRIKGHVPNDGKRFDVNIGSDPNDAQSPRPLHLAFHVKTGKLIANYFKNGWSSYHTEFPNMPIKPGSDFEVVIQCKYDNYKIAIGGKYFCSYKHHLSPDITKCIDARTDVEITNMSIEGSLSYQ